MGEAVRSEGGPHGRTGRRRRSPVPWARKSPPPPTSSAGAGTRAPAARIAHGPPGPRAASPGRLDTVLLPPPCGGGSGCEDRPGTVDRSIFFPPPRPPRTGGGGERAPSGRRGGRPEDDHGRR